MNKTYEITHIQLFDYVYENVISEHGDFEIIGSYSANLIINDSFVVQISGDKDQATFDGVCDSSECYWDNAELQDEMHEEIDKNELKKMLENDGFENNWGWLCDNAEIMNPEENKRVIDYYCKND